MRAETRAPSPTRLEPGPAANASVTRLLRRGAGQDGAGGRRCLLLAEPALIDAVRSKLAAGGVDVVAVALDMQSLMQALAAFEPDLVVIDLPETPTLMIEAVVSTRRHYPDIEVHVVMRGTAGSPRRDGRVGRRRSHRLPRRRAGEPRGPALACRRQPRRAGR